MAANRYLEAFKEKYNVVGLASAVAVSAALLNPLPLLVGLVAEAAYILFVSDSRWYQLRLARRFDAEIEARREELKARILPTLQPAMQSRFANLEQVRASINDQAQEQPEWFREVLRKLDFLLEKFLQFAAKDAQFQQYLQSVLAQECGVSNPAILVQRNAPSPNGANSGLPDTHWTQAAIARIQAQYDGELKSLQTNAQKERDDNTRAVLEKRLDVLGRRREFTGKIGRIQTNLLHQLSLLEDTFGLIADEIRAQPPEQVLADINDVVSQTNTMTQLLEDFAPFENSLNL